MQALCTGLPHVQAHYMHHDFSLPLFPTGSVDQDKMHMFQQKVSVLEEVVRTNSADPQVCCNGTLSLW